MPHTRSATISDAQIGRAFREVLALTRGWDIVRLADDNEPYGMVRQHDGHTPLPASADEAELSAPSLELLIQALLEEELETGRALAIDELFDDEEHGFNLNGISLGTLAAAMHLAPGAPIPRELLAAVNAVAAHHSTTYWGEDDEDDEGDEAPAGLTLHGFPRPGFMLANACIDHLLRGGIFIQLSDDSVLLDAELQPREGADAMRVGQALAEQALLAIVPALFDAGQTEELRRLEAHLHHVTDRALPRAATSSVGLALLCADYYATVAPDRDLLRHYMTQGCAALDLRLDQLDQAIIPRLVNDLYGLAKVAHDAGMLDTAAIGYARSFELRQYIDLDELDTLDGLINKPATMTGSMHAVIAELAVVTALEHGDRATAQRVLQVMRGAAEDEDDPITRWQAVYLQALIARAAGETAAARRGLEAIVAWGEAHAGDLDDRLMIVDFLLVAWVELARLELQESNLGRAAELVAWAESALDYPALQSLYPDRPDDPNDTRHRLRARLLEARAWVGWAEGQPETAASAVQEALRLITFALGAETSEGRHLAAQRDRITAGEGPQY